jgi:hypothetical protein
VLINKTIELENGKVEFKGELSQEELDLVLTMGLNMLLSKGAIPFTSKHTEVSPNTSEYKQ